MQNGRFKSKLKQIGQHFTTDAFKQVYFKFVLCQIHAKVSFMMFNTLKAMKIGKCQVTAMFSVVNDKTKEQKHYFPEQTYFNLQQLPLLSSTRQFFSSYFFDTSVILLTIVRTRIVLRNWITLNFV